MTITGKDIQTGLMIGSITVLLALSPWFFAVHNSVASKRNTPPASLLTHSPTQNPTLAGGVSR